MRFRRGERAVACRLRLCGGVLAAVLIAHLGVAPAASASGQSASAPTEPPPGGKSAEETGGKVAEPTPEQAAIAAWRATFSDALEVRLRALAATGQPDDLLVAGVAWPAVRGWRAAGAAAAQAEADPSTEWFATLAEARPREPLAAWLEASGCRRAWKDCEREEALAFLLDARPDDLTVQLLALAAALERGDGVMAQKHLQAAATAKEYWQPSLEMGRLLLEAVAGMDAPAPPADVATALGTEYRLHRAATVEDQAAVTAAGISAALPMPGHAVLARVCAAGAGAPEEHLDNCRKVLGRLAGSPVLAARMLGNVRGVLLAGDGESAAAVRERLRQLAWLQESAQKQMADSDGAPVPAEYMRRLLREGEVAALSLLLEINGVPLQAPAGWLPENPRLRSLVVDGREPDPASP